jgi:hypothetical protein
MRIRSSWAKRSCSCTPDCRIRSSCPARNSEDHFPGDWTTPGRATRRHRAVGSRRRWLAHRDGLSVPSIDEHAPRPNPIAISEHCRGEHGTAVLAEKRRTWEGHKIILSRRALSTSATSGATPRSVASTSCARATSELALSFCDLCRPHFDDVVKPRLVPRELSRSSIHQASPSTRFGRAGYSRIGRQVKTNGELVL